MERAQPPGPAHGRVDKRKRLRPMRSLSLVGSQAAFCTLRMAYADDYRRDPGAYSRALMGSPRADPAARHSAPPPSSVSSSSPPRSTSEPEQEPEPEPAHSAPVQSRPMHKDIPAVIRRLFPSLDSTAAVMQAAAQVTPCRQPQVSRTPPRPAPHSPSPPPLPSLQPPPPPRKKDPFATDDLAREISLLRPHSTTCSVKWAKAAPMDISGYPMADCLALAERECCSTLRLMPEQYLAIKQSLVRAGRTMPPGSFKKRDAQRLCRVDVNKTSKVFEWFCKLGWIPHAATRGSAQDGSVY